jgi:hypothetical protein
MGLLLYRKKDKKGRAKWDYIKSAKKLVKESSSLLDIDTGGGGNTFLTKATSKKFNRY